MKYCSSHLLLDDDDETEERKEIEVEEEEIVEEECEETETDIGHSNVEIENEIENENEDIDRKSEDIVDAESDDNLHLSENEEKMMMAKEVFWEESSTSQIPVFQRSSRHTTSHHSQCSPPPLQSHPSLHSH